jgi:methionyl-tRNA formyltransferase
MAIVLLYTEGLQSHLIYSRLLAAHRHAFSSVVRLPIIPYARKSGTKNWRLVLKAFRSAPSYLLLNILTLPIFGAISRLCGTSLAQTAQRQGIEFRAQSVIDAEFLDWLREKRPRYIINASSTIVSNDLIKVPRCGVLNYHGAPLPEFRGAANYYWLLVTGAPVAWGTLHYVEEGLDTGPVIARTEAFPIDKFASVFDCWMALALAGAPLFERLLPLMTTGPALPSTPQDHSRGVARSFPEAKDVRKIPRTGRRVMSLRDVATILRIAIKGYAPPAKG